MAHHNEVILSLKLTRQTSYPRSSSSSKVTFRTTFSTKYFLRRSNLDNTNYLDYFREERN